MGNFKVSEVEAVRKDIWTLPENSRKKKLLFSSYFLGGTKGAKEPASLQENLPGVDGSCQGLDP